MTAKNKAVEPTNKACIAQIGLQVEQLKIVQSNLAVLEGRVVLLDGNQDDSIRGAVDDRRTTAGLFIPGETCLLCVREASNVHQILQWYGVYIYPGQPDGRTGRWIDVASGKVLIVRVNGNQAREMERNRKGRKLIECLGLVKMLQPVNHKDSKDQDQLNPTDVQDKDRDNYRENSATTTAMSAMQHKIQRQELFAQWLVDRYGVDFLSTGSGVLDVAGGKGDLSAALQKRGIPSIILDPNPRIDAAATGAIRVIAHPLTGDGAALLGATRNNHKRADDNEDHVVCTQQEQSWIRSCSMIVGMHPDQATEAIVDLSLRLGVPFALLPCCVMPSQFPHRRLPAGISNGQPVRSYKSFCQYILAKTPLTSTNGHTSQPFHVDHLPFVGRNKIIFSLPVRPSTFYGKEQDDI